MRFNEQAVILEEFRGALSALLARSETDFADGGASILQYAEERTRHLATIAGEPGFTQALIAERDNVAMYAGIQVVRAADAADQRIAEGLTVAMSFAARLLAAAAV